MQREMSAYDSQVGGSHYQDFKIQPSVFINENNILFAEGNAIKYLCRHRNKGKIKDLEKAKHYIDMIIERDYITKSAKSDGVRGVVDPVSSSKVQENGDIEIDKHTWDAHFKECYGHYPFER